jgi:hypothetical protein
MPISEWMSVGVDEAPLVLRSGAYVYARRRITWSIGGELLRRFSER